MRFIPFVLWDVELILCKGSADNSGLTEDPCGESWFKGSVCNKLGISCNAIMVYLNIMLSMGQFDPFLMFYIGNSFFSCCCQKNTNNFIQSTLQ